MNQINDPVRRRFVALTPEERVRQDLLRRMIKELGYPLGLLAVEKELQTGRRVDLLCYAPRLLCPLLIIECKAKPCTEEAKKQAMGYNASLGAPFICVADSSEVHTLWFEGSAIASVPFLPTFEQLCQKAIFP